MCGGHGAVRQGQGFFVVQTTCPTCHGSGQTIKDPCKPCDGEGAIPEKVTIKVRIPAGTRPGRTFRVKGRGVATAKGTGDLLVGVEVAVPAKLSDEERAAIEALAATATESPRTHLFTSSPEGGGT